MHGVFSNMQLFIHTVEDCMSKNTIKIWLSSVVYTMYWKYFVVEKFSP